MSIKGYTRQVIPAAISNLREIFVEFAWPRSGERHKGPGGSRIQDRVTEKQAGQGTNSPQGLEATGVTRLKQTHT